MRFVPAFPTLQRDALGTTECNSVLKIRSWIISSLISSRFSFPDADRHPVHLAHVLIAIFRDYCGSALSHLQHNSFMQ